MEITLNLAHVFRPGANPVENARTLRRLLEFMIEENMDYLRARPRTRSLYRSGVVYGRTVLWEPIPAMYQRGFGDCKSLATALCAFYRLEGIAANPVFRWVYRFPETPETSPIDYHILVQTNSGWEDPSRELGMGYHEVSKFFSPLSFGDSEFLNQQHEKKERTSWLSSLFRTER